MTSLPLIDRASIGNSSTFWATIVLCDWPIPTIVSLGFTMVAFVLDLPHRPRPWICSSGCTCTFSEDQVLVAKMDYMSLCWRNGIKAIPSMAVHIANQKMWTLDKTAKEWWHAVIKPVIALDRVARRGLKKTDIKITPSTCVHFSLVLRHGHSSSTFWPTILLCDWYQPLQLRATQHYIIIIINGIFAIRQLQHELQRWSLINIPRKKNTRRTRDTIYENKIHLVLTKTTSLLYLLQAYLWSTPLVILAPPFPLTTFYREILPWLSPCLLYTSPSPRD